MEASKTLELRPDTIIILGYIFQSSAKSKTYSILFFMLQKALCKSPTLLEQARKVEPTKTLEVGPGTIIILSYIHISKQCKFESVEHFIVHVTLLEKARRVKPFEPFELRSNTI